MISVLYSDVDGTLTGPGGNLLAGPDGAPSLAATQALVDARSADLEVVLCSGRPRMRLGEVARLLGLDAYLSELGGVRVRNGGHTVTYEHGACPFDGPPAEHLRPAMLDLLATFPDQVEEATPWNTDREISMLLRGALDLDAARARLDAIGFAWADLHDNGASHRRTPALNAGGPLRSYHLAPSGISKGACIAHDIAERGLTAAQCAFVGDSPLDLDVAPYVSQVFIVANGPAHLPDMEVAAKQYDNVTFLNGHYGDGFAEAIAQLLFSRQ